MTHSSPSRTAVVRIEAGSDPASGSDSANAGDISPVAHARQEALLLLVGAEQPDRQRAELLDHQDQRARGARLGDLLDRHLQHQRAGAGAAVLLLERQPEDVVLAEQLADVPRVLAGAVDLGRARARSALDDRRGSCRGSPGAPAGPRRRLSVAVVTRETIGSRYGRPQARTEHRLLGGRAAARHAGDDRRGRAPRLRLDLDRRGLRLGLPDAAGVVGRATERIRLGTAIVQMSAPHAGGRPRWRR